MRWGGYGGWPEYVPVPKRIEAATRRAAKKNATGKPARRPGRKSR